MDFTKTILEAVKYWIEKRFSIIDRRFDGLATVEMVESAVEMAESAVETADGKMNAHNPVGTGSFSMNRKADTVVGNYSHAEGYDTTASGNYSHAEGSNTTASGIASHAEGTFTTASGNYSHAEGYTTIASNLYSHAEGSYTKASGPTSHAEGSNTTASGIDSHAEGALTTASGNYSHAEGNDTTASGDHSHAEGYMTTASGKYQHVQGKFNIDDVDAEGKALNTYAHIIGNGTSDTDRSNAHTVDWNGVGWYQGGLQIGGNAQDDGAKHVLLEGDAIPVPSTASIGQTIVVKAVDETGKPTEWEAVDLPSGGSGGGAIVLNCTINSEDETILESPIFNFEEIKIAILNGKNVVLLADDSFESVILVYKPTAVGDYYIEFRPNNSSMSLYLLNDNTMSDTN